MHGPAPRPKPLYPHSLLQSSSAQDELVASEMVFAGLLSDLSPEEAVALVSALVFQASVEECGEV